MKKIFLDCGFYAGVATKHYFNTLLDRNDWQIIAFEPNEELVLPDWVADLPDFTLRRETVWIKNGTVDFMISERNNGSYVEGLGSNAPSHVISTKAVNFSKFVAGLPEDAHIVCNMDIEGAEFPVLRKMLKDGTASRIKFLDIEFHHRLMKDETAESASQLIQALERQGVIVRIKIEL